jgi:hypothetical protein
MRFGGGEQSNERENLIKLSRLSAKLISFLSLPCLKSRDMRQECFIYFSGEVRCGWVSRVEWEKRCLAKMCNTIEKESERELFNDVSERRCHKLTHVFKTLTMWHSKWPLSKSNSQCGVWVEGRDLVLRNKIFSLSA